MTQSQTPLNSDQNGRGERHLSNESSTDSNSRYQPDEIGKQPMAIQSQKTTTEEIEEKTDTNGQKPPASPRGKKRPIRKQLIFTAVGVGAIVAGVFGFQWWQNARSHEQTDDASVSGHIHPVSSRLNGTVAAVLVEENQQVQQGQVLVRLDPRDYENQVQQTQAALNQAMQNANTAQSQIALSTRTTRGTTTQAQGNVSSASAAITNAQAGVQVAQAGVPTAIAQVATAQANLQRAQADFNRYRSLYQQGAISAQQFETARNANQVATAQVNSASEQVRQAQARVAQAQQDVARAQAQLTATQGGLQQAQAGQTQTQVNRNQHQAALAAVQRAQANLNNAQLQLSYTTITAPIKGTAGNRNVEVGQRVQPGTPLMAVVDGKNWVVANFKETQLENMHLGNSAQIKLDAFPNHPFRGYVESISPASGSQFALLPPDNATGNFTKIVQRIPVRIAFDPQSLRGYEPRITPGMSAVVTVNVK